MRQKVGVRFVVCVLVLTLGVVLSGCSNDPLAKQYRSGTSQNYIAGDGRVVEFAPAEREPPVQFASAVEDGSAVASHDYEGKVLVLNFWYAGCPPCRAEARDLQKIYEDFAPEGVDFLGVNVRDQPATARAFERTFGITYPSAIDGDDGTMQLAFTGVVAPSAVPTTLVLDKQGRVASRILGRIPDASVLRSLITTVLAEKAPSS
ncbi:TlpA disulfide reductase family protein [Parafrigoribacterium mesophilum]|uniref:TlpA family protein disulfide reductase n=1 Tax=Parafrigoribacterium mesophilum TaxID=433646 RepID=UPI0031FE1D0B